MQVYIFPLVNVTLFPRTTKPLNIFEPRYIAMVREAIHNKTPVALGFIEDPARIENVSVGQEVSYIKLIAGYGHPQIIEERLNGTLLVFLYGQGKLKLGKVTDVSRPFLVCEAEVIEDDNFVTPQYVEQLSVLRKSLVRWINTHIPDVNQRESFLLNVNSPEEIVGAYASYLVRDYDLQQVVLEMSNINEKIVFLNRLMMSNES